MRPTPAIGVSAISSASPVALPRSNSPKPRAGRVAPSSWCSGPPAGIGVQRDDLLPRLRQVDRDVGGEQRAPGAAAARRERDQLARGRGWAASRGSGRAPDSTASLAARRARNASSSATDRGRIVGRRRPRCRRSSLDHCVARHRVADRSLPARRSSTRRRRRRGTAATRGSGPGRRWCGRSASSAGAAAA